MHRVIHAVEMSRSPTLFRVRLHMLVPGFALLALCGCAIPPPDDAPPNPPFVLDAAQHEAGWEVLFDGNSLEAWRAFRGSDLPSGWHIVSGALYFDGRIGPPDLITRARYASFELVLEWRAEPSANSGILFRVREARSQTWETGPEFQILDAETNELLRTGTNYAVHPAAPHPETDNADGWNEARILVRGTEVEHWRNGARIVAYTLGSEDWKQRVAASKFDSMPGYGLETEGHIALQAHGNPIWFRNIRIRQLESN